MNRLENTQKRSEAKSALSWCWKERHFLIAALILAITAFGWDLALGKLRWVMRKEPVPWPKGVLVSEDFRLLTLPEQLGPYVLAERGDLDLEEEDLELLGVGTSQDKDRHAQRRSNWYNVRIYRDTRKAPGEPYSVWRLEVYYYTGGLDTVPHVPERCLVVGGATTLDSESENIPFKVPAARKPWDNAIAFRKVPYEKSDRLRLNQQRYVTYYIFSLNGKPEQSWEVVRVTLMHPLVRYCYFAKIQFAPLNEIVDSDEADKSAEDFVNFFLPSVLRTLPMPNDVQKLNSQE